MEHWFIQLELKDGEWMSLNVSEIMQVIHHADGSATINCRGQYRVTPVLFTKEMFADAINSLKA